MNQHKSTLRPSRPGDVDVLRNIEKSARSRYRSLQGFEQVADGPPIAAERFGPGYTVVAQWHGRPAGFVLMQVLDGLLYIANISVGSNAAGHGIGQLLLGATEARASKLGFPAVTLTTFKAPSWNGPWFRRYGYQAMPEDRIGPDLGSVLDRHATFLDMSTRETLWKVLE